MIKKLTSSFLSSIVIFTPVSLLILTFSHPGIYFTFSKEKK